MPTYDTFDPMAENPDAGASDYQEGLAKLGWQTVFTIGDSDHSPMHVNAWQRDRDGQPTEFAVDVWDQNGGSPFIKVDSFPEMMDLLARWAPLVQAASVTQLIAEVTNGRLATWGTVEQIAARVVFGITDALPAMKREEAQIREAARARRAAKQPANGG